jgi:tetratricopeptide (TPR) repeat protein
MKKLALTLFSLFCGFTLLIPFVTTAQTAIDDSIRYYYFFAYAQTNAVGDNREAIKAYSKILRLDPKDDEALMMRAKNKRGIGDYTGAESDYTRVLQLDPGSIAAIAGRSECRAKLKKYADAIRDNNLLISMEPGNPSFYTNRGLNKVQLNDLQGACDDFEKAKFLGGVYAAVLIRQFCLELY